MTLLLLLLQILQVLPVLLWVVHDVVYGELPPLLLFLRQLHSFLPDYIKTTDI